MSGRTLPSLKQPKYEHLSHKIFTYDLTEQIILKYEFLDWNSSND